MVKLLFIFITFFISVNSFALNKELSDNFFGDEFNKYSFSFHNDRNSISNEKNRELFTSKSLSSDSMEFKTTQSKNFNFNGTTSNQDYRQYLNDRQEQFYQGGTRALNHASDGFEITFPFY